MAREADAVEKDGNMETYGGEVTGRRGQERRYSVGLEEATSKRGIFLKKDNTVSRTTRPAMHHCRTEHASLQL